MPTIFVEKTNEAMLRVTSDDFGVEQELSDFFRFRPKGYQFSPKFRARVWDGFIYLYDINRKRLPFGLLPYIHAFSENNKYTVENIGKLVEDQHISADETKNYVNSLNAHGSGKRLEIRDYQYETIHTALAKRRCLIMSPTGSGKSFAIYAYTRWMLDHGERVILIVPTTSLVRQMYSDFEDYSSHNEWDVESNCHILYSGKERIFNKPVLITTWQSLHAISKQKGKDADEFFQRWTAVIGDEAHNFTGGSLLSVMNRLTNAKFRLGTTGTVQDEKISKLTLEGAFGPITRIITTKQLISANQLTDLRIKCLTLDYGQDTCKLVKKMDYAEELDFIVSNQKRREFIIKLAGATTGNTLVLFQFIEKHGSPMYELATTLLKNKRVFFISGEVNADIREDIRKELSSIDNAVVFASYGTTSTGVNIPSIENIIFSSPTKSKIRNLQSIGRGLRLKEGKSICTLYDIVDNLSSGKHLNYTLKHFKERLDIYSLEQFKFDITKVKFDI